MPELGEVELLAARLNARLQVEAAMPQLINGRAMHARLENMWQQCQSALIGARLAGIKRKGKYLLFHWQDQRGLLLAHLRLTGWWAWQHAPQTLIVAQGYELTRNPRLSLTFQWPNGDLEELIYYDDRVLGEIAFYPVADWQQLAPLKAQAPDLVSSANSVDNGFIKDENEFLARAQQLIARGLKNKRSRSVRDLLLDQTDKGLAAGIGNYLVAEVLYHAGVHPNRAFHSLTPKESKKIYQAGVSILQQVISGQANDNSIMVIYQHEQCPRGHAITREARGNRSSYFCGQCQQ